MVNEKRHHYLIKAFTALISGVVWIESPIFISGFVGIIFGLIMLVKGSVDLVMYIISRKYVYGSISVLLDSILALSFGFMSLVIPHFFSSLLSILIALYFIVDGIVKHSSVLLLRRTLPLWWMGFVINIIEISLGIIMLIDPFKSVLTMIFIGGIALILSGIYYLIRFIYSDK